MPGLTTAEKLLAHNTKERKHWLDKRPEKWPVSQRHQSQRADAEMRCASVAVKVTSPTGFLCLPATEVPAFGTSHLFWGGGLTLYSWLAIEF